MSSAEISIGRKKLGLRLGDITLADCEAMVNAANSHLRHGGGVAGAIVRRGGQSIQEECDRIGYTPTGTAAISGAGNLKARYVIHAVGPVWGEGDEEAKLKSAVLSALNLAVEHSVKSMAFPAISSGIFGFPLELCARILLGTMQQFLTEHAAAPRITVYLYTQHDYNVFLKVLQTLKKSSGKENEESGG